MLFRLKLFELAVFNLVPRLFTFGPSARSEQTQTTVTTHFTTTTTTTTTTSVQAETYRLIRPTKQVP